MKTSGAGFSVIDKKECKQKITSIKNDFPSDWDLPNVYLLHGDLSDEEMNDLYNHPKIKCFVSFTHGEGFGRPLLEASLVDLPIICSNWSGPVDFLDEKNTLLINGSLEKVPESVVWDDIIVKESSWFVVDEHNAYESLKYAFENIHVMKERAKALGRRNREKFSLLKMFDLFNETIDRYTKDMPSNVSLNLPKLKKINKEKREKIKLPVLKKVTK